MKQKKWDMINSKEEIIKQLEKSDIKYLEKKETFEKRSTS
jgi:hypothetical protein